MLRALYAACVLFVSIPACAADWPTKPNSSFTPGAHTDMSVSKICHTVWGADEREVTEAMKDDVRAKYHFDASSCPLSMYKGKKVHRAEIDHLIPRSLGGDDVKKNLWPECYEMTNKDKSRQLDGAHKKDRLETELHKRLCPKHGPVGSEETLRGYQAAFTRDWLALYHDTYPDE